MLRYSKDEKIPKKPPEARTFEKWNAKNKVNHAIRSILKYFIYIKV